MIELSCRIIDNDLGETKEVTLPCDYRKYLATDHDLEILDVLDGEFMLHNYNDIENLNDILERINSENPNMTVELLQLIMDAVGYHRLDEDELIETICEKDFMLELIEKDLTDCDDIDVISWEEMDEYEKAACFLSTELNIPFAKNIHPVTLENIQNQPLCCINWQGIWRRYYQMGFRVLMDEYEPDVYYIFNWERSN